MGDDDDEVEAVVVEQLSQHEYIVYLDRSRGDPLGIDVDGSNGVSLVVQAVNGGLVQAWNDKNPDRKVRPGDHLIDANGIRDDAVELMRQCKMNQLHCMKFAVGALGAGGR